MCIILLLAVMPEMNIRHSFVKPFILCTFFIIFNYLLYLVISQSDSIINFYELQ